MLEKLLIEFDMKVLTGLHIGGGKEFSAIGAVDSSVVRDNCSGRPMIPGSSLKGKMRSLLAREESPAFPPQKIDNDSDKLQRLFGSAGDRNSARPARLQFADAFMADQGGKLPLTEVKFENYIDRLTSVATPRQIERVVRGNIFKVRLTYNLDAAEELQEDMETLTEGLRLLSLDYLGGHGSRGYGRVGFTNFKVQKVSGAENSACPEIEDLLKDVEKYAVFTA